MRGRLALAVAAFALGLAGTAAAHAPARGAWLYVVKSRSTDPAREAAYNDWYDRIDVPDVLEVPGFERARRAETVPRMPGDPEGAHVALYDIASADIDRTIIDLTVGARRMTWRGRTTDLLKVTEASYYARVGTTAALGAKPAPLVRLAKILCCTRPAGRVRFEAAFAAAARAELGADARVARIGLYRLYRVMETEAMQPGEVPHYLAVIEYGGEDSAPPPAVPLAGRPEGGDTRSYRVLSDVPAPSR